MGPFGDGAGGVDQVVDNDGSLAFDIANHVVHFGLVRPGPALVEDGQRSVQPLRQFPGPGDAAHVGRDDDHILELLFEKVISQDRHRF